MVIFCTQKIGKFIPRIKQKLRFVSETSGKAVTLQNDTFLSNHKEIVLGANASYYAGLSGITIGTDTQEGSQKCSRPGVSTRGSVVLTSAKTSAT